MSKRLNWEKANKEVAIAGPLPTRYILVKTDEDFWRSWRDDKIAMRAAGYRIRKVNGQWQAYIEVR